VDQAPGIAGIVRVMGKTLRVPVKGVQAAAVCSDPESFLTVFDDGGNIVAVQTETVIRIIFVEGISHGAGSQLVQPAAPGPEPDAAALSWKMTLTSRSFRALSVYGSFT